MLTDDNTQGHAGVLPPNTSLQNGHFIVQRVLGQGGFGITYEARDTVLNRTVAIKEFFPEGCSRSGREVVPRSADAAAFATARDAFIGEAQTLAQFSHPSIVDVYSVFSENDSAYMVMEFLRGQALQQIVEERGALAPDEAIVLLEPVCEALEEIHRAGLIHGDIKPANIMRTENGRVVLLDFGLTRRIETDRYATVRFSPVRFGTAGYAPLEQYGRQAQLGPFTDIYALAATLFFLLSGEVPPEATDRATGVPLPDVRGFNTGVSAALARSITDGMAMDAKARPQTVGALRTLWKNADEDKPVAAAGQYAVTILPPADGGRWGGAATAEDAAGKTGQWQTDTIYGQRTPQQRAPQQRPQSRRRNPAGAPDPFRFDRVGEPRGGLFIGPGCPGGCTCGCLVLFGIIAFISLFVGSILETLLRLLTG